MLLTLRNPLLAVARLGQTAALALLFGLVFFQPDVDEFELRIGLSTFVCLNVSFGSMPEMKTMLDGRDTAYKLSRAGMLDETFYILSVFLSHVPRAAMNSLVLSIIVYLMAGFAADFSRFFFFWLVVAGVELSVAGIDRALTVALPTVELAQSVSGLTTSIFLLMGGFLATRSNIPLGMRWCYWISPFSWGLRSLVINEFSHSRYDDPLSTATEGSSTVTRFEDTQGTLNTTADVAPLPGSMDTATNTSAWESSLPSRKGNVFMDVFEIQYSPNSDAWKFGGVAMLYLQWILYGLVLSAVALRGCRHDHRPGTRRIFGAGLKQEVRDRRRSSAYSSGSLQASTPQDRPGLTPQSTNRGPLAQISSLKGDSPGGGEESNPNACSSNRDQRTSSAIHRLSSAIAPCTLTFEDVRYSIKVSPKGAHAARLRRETHQFGVFNTVRARVGFSPPSLVNEADYTANEGPSVLQGSKTQTCMHLPLLRGVWGTARPRRMMCLMGASGAGKTTLMDVLAGRKTQGKESGNIRINNQVLSKRKRAALIAYCEQQDQHMPTAMVEEVLDFSARMRLEASMANDSQYVQKMVDELLNLLELNGIRRRAAGSLSVGESKRLSIGVELAANPSLLFLDEPTTGLDARSATQVMRVLRNVSNTGRTVVCTIHQPSYDVFVSFDDLVLLSSGGRQVYSGPIGYHCRALIEHFMGCPTVESLPPRVNPATWMLQQIEQQQDRIQQIAESGRLSLRCQAPPACATNYRVNGKTTSTSGASVGSRGTSRSFRAAGSKRPAYQGKSRERSVPGGSNLDKLRSASDKTPAKLSEPICSPFSTVAASKLSPQARLKLQTRSLLLTELFHTKRAGKERSMRSSIGVSGHLQSHLDDSSTFRDRNLDLDSHKQGIGVLDQQSDDSKLRFRPKRISHYARFQLVLQRTLVGSYRNLSFNGSRYATLLFLGAMVGVMFWGQGRDSLRSQASVLSMLGVTQMTMGFFCVGTFNPQVSMLYKVRPLFYREQSIGLYSPNAYYLSLVLKEILYVASFAAMVVPVLYIFLGFRLDIAWPLLEMILTFCLTALWLSWTSHLCSSVIQDELVAHVTTGVINNTAALFNAVFVGGIKNYSTVPRFVATYLNPIFMANVPMGLALSHCYSAEVGATEEERLSAGCPAFPSVEGNTLRVVTAEGFVENFVGSTYDDRWRYYLGIAAVGVGVAVVTQVFAGCCIYSRR